MFCDFLWFLQNSEKVFILIRTGTGTGYVDPDPRGSHHFLSEIERERIRELAIEKEAVKY